MPFSPSTKCCSPDLGRMYREHLNGGLRSAQRDRPQRVGAVLL
jgi:hypothetical protein